MDTGAAHRLFERKYAEMLGLHVESGRLQRFRTVAGSFWAYEHEVTIQTLGIELASAVFFAHDEAFNRNFLGRSGWLDRLRIAFIDYDRTVFLSPTSRSRVWSSRRAVTSPVESPRPAVTYDRQRLALAINNGSTLYE